MRDTQPRPHHLPLPARPAAPSQTCPWVLESATRAQCHPRHVQPLTGPRHLNAGGEQRGGHSRVPHLRCRRIWELSWGLAFCSHHQRASIRGCRLINLEARLIPEPRRVLFPRNLAPGDSQGLCDTRAVTRPRCCAPGLLSAGSGTPGDPSSPREGCAGTPAGEGGAARGN